jgi:ElaB/YqjD/DUF883 family membrane-anchored ribosome-binding protein
MTDRITDEDLQAWRKHYAIHSSEEARTITRLLDEVERLREALEGVLAEWESSDRDEAAEVTWARIERDVRKALING